MSQHPQQTRRSPRSPRFDRFLGWFSYLLWLVSVFCLFLTDLDLLSLTFLLPQSRAFWQEMIPFRLAVPPAASPQPEPQVGLFVVGLLLLDVGLLWFTYAYGKHAIVDFLAWKNFSSMRQLAVSHSTRRQLAFLYTLARFENERFQFAQFRRKGEIPSQEWSRQENLSSDGTLRRVGPFSWFYLLLFNYLLPPSAIQERQAFFTYLRQFASMVQVSPEEELEPSPPIRIKLGGRDK